MPKSAEEYREEARRLRELAEQISQLDNRKRLLDVATTYDRLARRADGLAKFEKPLASDDGQSH
jgi:hypothetical protein